MILKLTIDFELTESIGIRGNVIFHLFLKLFLNVEYPIQIIKSRFVVLWINSF